MKTISGDKTLARALNWLLKNAEKPPKKYERFEVRREILEGFCVTRHNITAADGFSLVSMPTPGELFELVDDEPRTYRADIPVRDFNVVAEPIEGDYPDIHQVIPNNMITVFEIALNPRILSKVLEGFEPPVVLRFYGLEQPFEVLQDTGEDSSRPNPERYGLVMPMFRSDSRPGKWYWRPRNDTNKD